ncbi:MAG: phosphonate C-P lyase system protein PhnH [Cyanobacteria bacterium P01_F01_bin.33]
MLLTRYPGFRNPVLESQATFRALLNAMAHPGTIFNVDVPVEHPTELAATSTAVCLTLFDLDTTVWLQPCFGAEVRQWLAFHTGCRMSEDAAAADFALVGNPSDMPSLLQFGTGEPETPEASTTAIVQVQQFDRGEAVTLRGPGIQTERAFAVEPLPVDFWAQRQAMTRDYPLGVDVMFCSDRLIAALPRTTAIEIVANPLDSEA